ncbi:MAG TPA: outer membrane beta-barrel protein [Terracidiphilus sp.]|jgi:opacity protein-like surface antigen
MKKIALSVFLLAVCVAAGRAQESRQDISLSGDTFLYYHMNSPADIYVGANTPYGALASYRFMLTPSSALEANYGITYQNTFHYNVQGWQTGANILTRTQELSAAYVRSFNYRKFNPFLEAGPAALLFLPIRNSGTNGTQDAQRQTEIGLLYGAGFAYEISPSFDIRGEYRGIVIKVPDFGLSSSSSSSTTIPLNTNRWYKSIFVPTIGVAYHF